MQILFELVDSEDVSLFHFLSLLGEAAVKTTRRVQPSLVHTLHTYLLHTYQERSVGEAFCEL